MHHNLLIAGVVVAAAMISLISDGPPRSAEAHAISNVQVISQNAGKCMEIGGGSGQTGALVIQWTCVGSPWQQWEVVPYDSTWHFIYNRYTLLCLDAPTGVPNGGQIWQWPCNYGDNQKWQIPPSAGWWGALKVKATGRCANVQNGSTGDNVPIVQTTCDGSQPQTWQLGLAYAKGTAPATGKWGSGDGTTDARPPVHHIVECEPGGSGTYDYPVGVGGGNYCSDNPGSDDGGHWSLDYFAASGTQLKFYGLGVGALGTNITAQVWAIAPTCSGDYQGQGNGNTVFVDIYSYPYGQWYGWMSFGHLKDIAVTPGQWISGGQVLGKTNFWPYRAGCWQVNYPNGVHTHIEMWNKYRYSCYKNWYGGGVPIDVSLGYTNPLGDIGRANYSAYRSACID